MCNDYKRVEGYAGPKIAFSEFIDQKFKNILVFNINVLEYFLQK